MSPLVRLAAALALVAAASPAAAYVRETTVSGSPNEGLCLWWQNRTVRYHVNASAVTHSACGSAATGPAAAEAEVVAGFDAWGAASSCTDFHFEYGGSTNKLDVARDGVNLVVFRSGRCTGGQTPAANNCWDSLNYGATTTAITTTHFDADGLVADADLELFAWDGISPSQSYGHYFSCVGPDVPSCPSAYAGTGCNADDVRAVVTHEAGHVLGLDHPCEYNEVRTPRQYPACSAGSYPQIMNPLVGDSSQRGLKQDDIDGVCAIYPKGGPTLTCGAAPKKQGGSGGCGSAGGAGALALVLGALSVTRIRRRTR